MKVVIRMTRSQQMALTDILIEHLRGSGTQVFVDCSSEPAIETTTDQLLQLVSDTRELEHCAMRKEPEVTRRGALDLQVCVPSDWTDQHVVEFANEQVLCGTTHGWAITRAGDRHLNGDPERRPCEQRKGFVHIMVHA